MHDSSLELTTDGGQTYADKLMARRRRNRVAGFSACVALWLLSAIPLARLSSDDGGGAGVAVAYLVAGFGIALVARVIYALLRKRTFWSPWLFVTAGVLAIMSYAVVSAGEKEPVAAAALTLIRWSPVP